jgi:hypothetical protein
MATSIDLMNTMSAQSAGFISRTATLYGAYTNAATPVFTEVADFSTGGNNRIYFNFTSADVGKVAIWVQALSGGFAGSIDLGSQTTFQTDTPIGWTSLFSVSRDWAGANSPNNALTYVGMIGSAKLITTADVGGYYEYVNTNGVDILGSTASSLATALIVVDIKGRSWAQQNPVVSVRSAWSSEKSSTTSPSQLAVSSQNPTTPNVAIEVAAVMGKIGATAGTPYDTPTVSLANEKECIFIPIDGVVPSANTSSNGTTKGTVKVRVLRNVRESYYNQPTFSNPSSLYACGAYGVVKVGG